MLSPGKQRSGPSMRRVRIGSPTGKIGADAIVGSVGHDLADRAVEACLQVFILLAEADAVAERPWNAGSTGTSATRRSSAPSRLSMNLERDSLSPSTKSRRPREEVEVGLLELAVGFHGRLRVTLLQVARVLAAIDRPDCFPGESGRRRIPDQLGGLGHEGRRNEVVAAREGDALGPPLVDLERRYDRVVFMVEQAADDGPSDSWVTRVHSVCIVSQMLSADRPRSPGVRCSGRGS